MSKYFRCVSRRFVLLKIAVFKWFSSGINQLNCNWTKKGSICERSFCKIAYLLSGNYSH